MLESFDFEKHFGVKCFVSEQDGLGGKLRSLPEDFVVEEQGEPKPGDGYTALRIRYRNWESHSLRLRIQRDLGLREGDITVAGTKDKRAVVTQWITVRRRTPPTLHIPDVEVLENRPCSSLLRAGEHDGNNFRIRIKQMEMEGEEAVQRARDIAAAIGTGWPNYFGIQRFGAFRPITHVVGKELVCSGAEKAVKIYLGSPGITTGQEKEARQMAEEGAAWQDVMEAMPRHLNFENIMLRHLCEREGDYEGALLRLPRPLLLLFVHSYQSYMFNRILSRRLEMGLPLDRPVEGDLIQPPSARIQGGRPRFVPVTGSSLLAVSKALARGKGRVTASLPGTEAPFAEGEQGEIERKILDEEGLTKDSFHIQGLREASSRGTRRPILLVPHGLNMEWDDGGLLVRVDLLSGEYATTVLREIMKSPNPLAY